MKKERIYHSEAERKNSEGAIKYLQECKKQSVSLEEVQRQILKNCRDNDNDNDNETNNNSSITK